jgi:hypothetical protein
MPDNPRKKYHDGHRCSLQPGEVKYWKKAFDCSAREYALAIEVAKLTRGAPLAWLVRNALRKADLRLKRGRRG